MPQSADAGTYLGVEILRRVWGANTTITPKDVATVGDLAGCLAALAPPDLVAWAIHECHTPDGRNRILAVADRAQLILDDFGDPALPCPDDIFL